MLETISMGLVCLALNVYHEAKNQPLEGQFAVADVVMNRVADPRYPDTVCEVVKQGPVKESWRTRETPDPNDAEYFPVRHRCQFSWYCDGKSDKPRNQEAWLQAQTVAHVVATQGSPGLTGGATHYHADYVQPEWASTKTFTTKIGDHLFYRWELPILEKLPDEEIENSSEKTLDIHANEFIIEVELVEEMY